jgi:biotin transport system permease protein
VLTAAYRPGRSWVHRAPAGLKLLLLAAGLTALALVRSPVAVAAGAVLVAGLATVARLPARLLAAQVAPVAGMAALIAAFQMWLAGPATALVVAGSLLVAVTAAGVLTLTTRVEQLLDVVVAALGPLRRVGARPERVALVLALTLRSVPVLAGLVRQAQEARLARGARRSLRALAVPLLIRTLRHADQLGEALAARGVDDEDPPRA